MTAAALVFACGGGGELDAGARGDGGVSDGGAVDGGAAGDAGSGGDAGSDTDGGAVTDAGGADASVPDGGAGGDAAATDAGLDCGGFGQPCAGGGSCDEGYVCDEANGRCLPPAGSRPTCGGFVGATCDSSPYTECVYFSGADYGPCLTPAEAACACTTAADAFGCP